MAGEFDLPPDLLVPPRQVNTLARAGFFPWLFDKIDGWLGLPRSGPQAAAFWGIASLASLVLTWAGWKLTLSMGRAWTNYTRGRLSAPSVVGSLVVAAPAVISTSLSAYCLHRARMVSSATPPTQAAP